MTFKHDNDVRFFLNERNKFLIENELKVDLVLFGDSITRRFDISRYMPNNLRILNSGIGGDNIQNMVKRVKYDVMDFNPKNVLFMGGINNLRNCLINNADFSVCKSEIITGIEQLIKEFKSNDVNLTVCLITKNHEINHDFVQLNDWIESVNNEINKLCDEYEIKVIDYNEVLTNEYGQLKLDLALDGLHPEEIGFLKMTKHLKNLNFFDELNK